MQPVVPILPLSLPLQVFYDRRLPLQCSTHVQTLQPPPFAVHVPCSRIQMRSVTAFVVVQDVVQVLVTTVVASQDVVRPQVTLVLAAQDVV